MQELIYGVSCESSYKLSQYRNKRKIKEKKIKRAQLLVSYRVFYCSISSHLVVRFADVFSCLVVYDIVHNRSKFLERTEVAKEVNIQNYDLSSMTPCRLVLLTKPYCVTTWKITIGKFRKASSVFIDLRIFALTELKYSKLSNIDTLITNSCNRVWRCSLLTFRNAVCQCQQSRDTRLSGRLPSDRGA
jgi:hypothetical protein